MILSLKVLNKKCFILETKKAAPLPSIELDPSNDVMDSDGGKPTREKARDPLPLVAFTVGLKEKNFTIGDNKDQPDIVLFDYEALVSINSKTKRLNFLLKNVLKFVFFFKKKNF